MKVTDAIKISDVVVTVTGNKHVITVKDIKNAKDGIILANSGHFDVEIDVDGLRKTASASKKVRPFLEQFKVGVKTVYLAGEGRLINLAAAEGHPSEVMDLSFAGQSLALEYIVKNKDLKGVIQLPKQIDQEIASVKLKFMGIDHDELTLIQKKYLETWKEGT